MEKKKKNIAVLVSGSGSNLQSILDGCDAGEINGVVKVVISSREGVFALERAKKHNAETRVFSLKDFSSNEKRDEAIIGALKDFEIDLVVLAGYLGILTPELIREYKNKIINIHPALLPSYGGKGFFGLNVHKAVIAAKEKKSGATVHYVDEGTDTGEIIMQESLDVYESDTPESLQERILNTIEHKLLKQAVQKLCK